MNPNIIFSLITGEASAVAARARRSAIEYVIAGIAALVGFAFLLVAGYIYLARLYGDLEVAIGFAAGFLGIAVLLLVYHRISARARARKAKDQRSGELMALASTVAIAALPSLLSKKGAVAGIALPIISAIAYSIYRENKGDGDDEGDRR
jgi:hypothetical protein